MSLQCIPYTHGKGHTGLYAACKNPPLERGFFLTLCYYCCSTNCSQISRTHVARSSWHWTEEPKVASSYHMFTWYCTDCTLISQCGLLVTRFGGSAQTVPWCQGVDCLICVGAVWYELGTAWTKHLPCTIWAIWSRSFYWCTVWTIEIDCTLTSQWRQRCQCCVGCAADLTVSNVWFAQKGTTCTLPTHNHHTQIYSTKSNIQSTAQWVGAWLTAGKNN